MAETFHFVFVNSQKNLTVILEPSCEELFLPTKSKIEVSMKYDILHRFEVDLTEQYLTLYLWQEGQTRVFIDSVEVTPPSVREHA